MHKFLVPSVFLFITQLAPDLPGQVRSLERHVGTDEFTTVKLQGSGAIVTLPNWWGQRDWKSVLDGDPVPQTLRPPPPALDSSSSGGFDPGFTLPNGGFEIAFGKEEVTLTMRLDSGITSATFRSFDEVGTMFEAFGVEGIDAVKRDYPQALPLFALFKAEGIDLDGIRSAYLAGTLDEAVTTKLYEIREALRKAIDAYESDPSQLDTLIASDPLLSKLMTEMSQSGLDPEQFVRWYLRREAFKLNAQAAAQAMSDTLYTDQVATVAKSRDASKLGELLADPATPAPVREAAIRNRHVPGDALLAVLFDPLRDPALFNAALKNPVISEHVIRKLAETWGAWADIYGDPILEALVDHPKFPQDMLDAAQHAKNPVIRGAALLALTRREFAQP